MIEFTNQVHVHRPVAVVYAFVADLENTPRWNWAIEDTTKVSPGPVGVGTRYTQRRSVPTTAVEELAITDMEPDRSLSVAGILAGMEALLDYRFEPDGAGTLLTNRVRLRQAGASRVLAPLLRLRIERAVAENLNTLKGILERAG